MLHVHEFVSAPSSTPHPRPTLIFNDPSGVMPQSVQAEVIRSMDWMIPRALLALTTCSPLPKDRPYIRAKVAKSILSILSTEGNEARGVFFSLSLCLLFNIPHNGSYVIATLYSSLHCWLCWQRGSFVCTVHFCFTTGFYYFVDLHVPWSNFFRHYALCLIN